MRRWILALLTALVVPLAGCQAAPAPGPAGSGSTTGFPLALAQQDGELRLDKVPERVYVVDSWSLDIVTSLGVKPIGAAAYFPPSAWLVDSPQLDGVQITTVTDALPLEKIAATRPDLIVDLSGGAVEEGTADKLRKIAPLLLAPKDWLADGWRDRVRHAGTALGRSTTAEEIIGQAEQTLAGIRAERPELIGAPLTFARLDPPATFTLVVDESDFTRRFLNTELGFTTPKTQVTAYGAGKFEKVGGSIEGVTLERGDLLDADAAAALIWFQDDQNLAALERQQVWRRLPVVADKRLVPMDIDAAIALRTPTPASIAWAADNLLPQLATAVAKAGTR